eukprot:gene25032-biopygen10483
MTDSYFCIQFTVTSHVPPSCFFLAPQKAGATPAGWGSAAAARGDRPVPRIVPPLACIVYTENQTHSSAELNNTVEGTVFLTTHRSPEWNTAPKDGLGRVCGSKGRTRGTTWQSPRPATLPNASPGSFPGASAYLPNQGKLRQTTSRGGEGSASPAAASSAARRAAPSAAATGPDGKFLTQTLINVNVAWHCLPLINLNWHQSTSFNVHQR